MNRRLLPILASTVLLVAGWTALAFACEDKAATAQSTTAKNADAKVADARAKTCTAKMAAKCTPAEKAACKYKGAKTTAVTASSSSSKKSAHSCEGMESAAKKEGCSHDKNTAVTASAKANCGGAAMAGFSGEVDAVVAGGPGCSHGTMASEKGHSNCDACHDMARYDDEIRSAGGQTQIVRLKNGVMFIHTADSPKHVHSVQAAMTRRSERLSALTSAGDRAKLCPDCKTMRGAMASGKLNREFVTIEGGCLTLMTSNDRAIVAKLHALAGNEMARKS